MAGHIQDCWYKTETTPDGKTIRVKTDRYGTGLRYRARYIGPDGTEKSKSFPDRQRRAAEAWLAQTKADMERGQSSTPGPAGPPSVSSQNAGSRPRPPTPPPKWRWRPASASTSCRVSAPAPWTRSGRPTFRRS
jgi:hypothetical protein